MNIAILGQSCLSIAAQYDHEELAKFLLPFVKTYQTRQEEQGNYNEHELDITKRVFNVNPNSRDMKGWTCTCVAVFHHSLRVLRLLLQHGGDPSIRSSYQKNAWDLARDEVDAAEHVTKSRSDIREILLEFFHQGEGVKSMKTCCGDERSMEGDKGSAMLMNIEMNEEMMRDAQQQQGTGQRNKQRSHGAPTKKAKAKGKGKKS